MKEKNAMRKRAITEIMTFTKQRKEKKKIDISLDFMSYIILFVAFGNFQTILG